MAKLCFQSIWMNFLEDWRTGRVEIWPELGLVNISSFTRERKWSVDHCCPLRTQSQGITRHTYELRTPGGCSPGVRFTKRYLWLRYQRQNYWYGGHGCESRNGVCGHFPKPGARTANSTANARRRAQTVFSHPQPHHETRSFYICLKSSVSFPRMLVFGLCDLCLLSHGAHYCNPKLLTTQSLWQTATPGSS